MAETEKDLAVLTEAFKGHVELNHHQFQEMKSDMTHIKNGQAANAQAYQRGIERVHERLDGQSSELSTIKASVENVAAGAKSAVKEGLQDQKIWIYAQALAIAGTILLFILKEFVMKG